MSLEETYKALDTLLKDEGTFKQVVEAVFESIDTDKSGSIDIKEIEVFINSVCKEMGIGQQPDKAAIETVFKELDTDKSNSIDKEELGKFLRTLFEEQKKQLEAAMKK